MKRLHKLCDMVISYILYLTTFNHTILEFVFAAAVILIMLYEFSECIRTDSTSCSIAITTTATTYYHTYRMATTGWTPRKVKKYY